MKTADNIENYVVNISEPAKNDLREIIRFISKSSPINLINILKGMESPWRIIYKIDNDIVNVLVIIDSRRNAQDILVEKLVNK